MSPTPIDELARRAGQALRDRADDIARSRPDVERLRRRRDTGRAVLVTALVAAVVVGAGLVALRARPATGPIIGEGDAEPSGGTESHPGPEETPQALTPRMTITSGTYEGSDRTWTMRAWLTDEGVCIELAGIVCGGLPAGDLPSVEQPLGFVGTSGSGAPEETGCVFGPVHSTVASIVVTYDAGETVTLAPVDGGELPTNFYGACWTGHRRPLLVEAFDEQGTLIASDPLTTDAATACRPASHSPDPFDEDAENTPFDVGPLCPRGGHSTVWTGSEMVVWGGWGDELGRTTFSDGAAFNPTPGTWRLIADAPLAPRQYHVAAWTGSEMLVVGGGGRRSGAAYDPADDTWRMLPDAPLPMTGEPIAGETGWVWTGDSLVVWHVRTDRVAAYSPATNRWRGLPAVGLEVDRGVLRWSGQEVYALGTQSVYPEAVPLLAARLDQQREAWERLPAAELWTDENNVAASPELTVWVGGSLLAWTDAGEDGRTLAFDPATDMWTEVTSTSLRGCEAQPEPLALDERVLAFGWCGMDAIYDPATDTWTSVNLDSLSQARYAVWTGREVLTWGDTCCYGAGEGPFTVRAWRYSPPPN